MHFQTYFETESLLERFYRVLCGRVEMKSVGKNLLGQDAADHHYLAVVYPVLK